MDMRFGTWNVRSLYRSGSLTTVSGELEEYKLDLVGVQEVRWVKGGTEPAGDYTFFYGNGNAAHHLGTGFFYSMGEVRGAYNILVGRPEGRRPLGRPRHRWEDNIKMDLREIGFGDVDWIDLAQNRGRWRALVNMVMNLQVP
jgi:hypothetical protein